MFISLWWLKVLWFVYCWMFLMDVGYIQYYYQRVWLPGHWLFWKEGQAFVLFSFHLVASSRVRSSLRWRDWFVCSHDRWIWLPCAVRSLCGQCPFVGVGPTLYLNSRTASALRRYRLFLWIFGCNVWGSFWWIQGWNWLYYRFYWYMLTILCFHWW